jgi:hypothetical protein
MKRVIWIVSGSAVFLISATIIVLTFLGNSVQFGSPYLSPRFSSEAEFTGWAIKEFKRPETFPEASFEKNSAGQFFVIKYVKDARGFVDVPDFGKCYFIPHSWHENPKIGDITLAHCGDKFYISRDHVCGALRLKVTRSNGAEDFQALFGNKYLTWEIYNPPGTN